MDIYISFHICIIGDHNVFQIFPLWKSADRLYAKGCIISCFQLCGGKCTNCICIWWRLFQNDLCISGVGNCNFLRIRKFLIAFLFGSKLQTICYRKTGIGFRFRLRNCKFQPDFSQCVSGILICHRNRIAVISDLKTGLGLYGKGCRLISGIEHFRRKLSHLIILRSRKLDPDSLCTCILYGYRLCIRRSLIALFQCSKLQRTFRFHCCSNCFWCFCLYHNRSRHCSRCFRAFIRSKYKLFHVWIIFCRESKLRLYGKGLLSSLRQLDISATLHFTDRRNIKKLRLRLY